RGSVAFPPSDCSVVDSLPYVRRLYGCAKSCKNYLERVQDTLCISTNVARKKHWRNELSPGDIVIVRCSIQNDSQNRFKPRPAIILAFGNNRREVVVVPMSSRSGYVVGTYIDPTDDNGLDEQGIALILDRQSRSIREIIDKEGFLSKSVFKRVLRDCNM
ncbi:uncharacterized protein METZ01_LOCUS313778, partial [marine metagenome]